MIVRLSDFKSNEYRKLIGGSRYEPEEENPMLGFRGATRYISEDFGEAFAMECEALKRVRGDMGLTNVEIMVPFVRTVGEAKQVIDLLAQNGLKRGENGLRITLAVAGFTLDDLVIELVENQLMVRGKQSDDGDRVFLHRGIAARQFQRAFMLADGIEVTGARLDNGLLEIDLLRPMAEPRMRTIRIDAGKEAGRADNTIDITARRSGSR